MADSATRAPEHHPRPPRPRWQDFRRRGCLLPAGLSRWQIPILTLADRAGGRDTVLCSDGAFRLFAEARRHFSQAELIAVVAGIAHCTFTNTFNRLARTEIDAFLPAEPAA